MDANTARILPGDLHARAIADVRLSSREAWLGWLERGSREDWAQMVGTVPIPAIIVAGAEDGDLGAETQRRLNLPHYPNGRVAVVAGAAHLIPYEQPTVLADLIARHLAEVQDAALSAPFARLLGSDRVSQPARAAMIGRSYPVAGDNPWSPAERAAVIALIGQVLAGGAGDG